ncbi:unnamed protein product, partial [Mycena citricolor]
STAHTKASSPATQSQPQQRNQWPGGKAFQLRDIWAGRGGSPATRALTDILAEGRVAYDECNQALTEHLAPPGRMFISVGSDTQKSGVLWKHESVYLLSAEAVTVAHAAGWPGTVIVPKAPTGAVLWDRTSDVTASEILQCWHVGNRA